MERERGERERWIEMERERERWIEMDRDGVRERDG